MTFIELLLVAYVVILYTKDWLAKKVEYYLWNLESQPNRQVLERKRTHVGLFIWQQFEK